VQGPADAASPPEAPATATGAWDDYSPARRWTMLAILFLIGTSFYIDRNIISILIQPLKTEFAFSDTQVGLLSGFAFALFYSLVGLPLSNFADRSDRKWLLIGAMTFWSLFTALCGVVANFWQMMFCRMGVGGSESIAMPISQSLIADYFPPKDRTKALAVLNLTATSGFLIGLAGGAWIADHYGWRAAMLICGLGALPAVLLGLIGLAEPRRRHGFPSIEIDAEPFITAFAGLFRKRSYRNIVLAFTLYYASSQGAIVFLPAYLIRQYGLTLTQAGNLYAAVSAVASLTASLAAGVVIDRLARRDRRWLAWAPAITILIACPCFELAMAAHSLFWTMTMIGLGIAFTAATLPALFATTIEVCGRRRALAVSIALATSALIGAGLAAPITGMLSDAMTVAALPGEGLRRALAVMFTLFALCAVTLVAVARGMRHDTER
jgi:predicted MFS family arabinose efflux permease